MSDQEHFDQSSSELPNEDKANQEEVEPELDATRAASAGSERIEPDVQLKGGDAVPRRAESGEGASEPRDGDVEPEGHEGGEPLDVDDHLTRSPTPSPATDDRDDVGDRAGGEKKAAGGSSSSKEGDGTRSVDRRSALSQEQPVPAEESGEHRFNVKQEVYIEEATRKPPGPDTFAIPPSKLEDARRIFAAPPDFAHLRHLFGAPNGQLFLVFGPNLSGKFATAVNVALAARPEVLWSIDDEDENSAKAPEVLHYRRSSLENAPLDRAMEQVPPRSVVILRDAFDKNLLLEHLSGIDLVQLRQVLVVRRIDLVLTTEFDAASLKDLDTPRISALVPDLGEVFEQHRQVCLESGGRIAEIASALDRAWSGLKEELRLPSHIARFFDALRELPGPPSQEELQQLAKEAGGYGQVSARSWFRELGPNPRLFALLLGLLEGIDLELLVEIFSLAAATLRQDGLVELQDPRSFGARSLLLTVRAEEENGEVRFGDAPARLEVDRQIENHSHLLWSLKDLLIELIRQHSEREFARFRLFLGAALGHLGIHRPDRFEDVLGELARSGDKGVAVTAGYALDRACRLEPSSREHALDWLERCILSGLPEPMWTAGSAIWRLYVSHHKLPETRRERKFLNRLRHLLRVLIQRGDKFALRIRSAAWQRARESTDPDKSFKAQLDNWSANIVRSCVFAIARMMEADPLATCTMLGKWLGEPPTDAVHRLAVLVCGAWLSAAEWAGESPPGIRLREALLEVAGPILSSEEEFLLRRLLTTLASWLDHDSDRDRTISVLLRLVLTAELRSLYRLRGALLTTWVRSDSVQVRRDGRNLLRRIQNLLGVPLFPSEGCRGILLFDTSRPGLETSWASRRALWVEALMEGYAELELIPLGRGEAVDTAAGPPGLADLRAGAPRPRLASAALEDDVAERADLLIAVHRGPIFDWSDFGWPELEHDRGVSLVWKREEDASGECPAAFESWHSTPARTDHAELCEWLDEVRFQVAARGSARAMLEMGSSGGTMSGQQEPSSTASIADEEIFADLHDRLDAISSVSALSPDLDPLPGLLRQISVGLEVDFIGWSELLHRWLVANDQPTRERVALAAAISYFRTPTHRPPPESVELRALGELTRAVCSAGGWQAGQAVLEAVRRWWDDPAWTELLLPERATGGPLLGWIEPLLPEHLEDLRILLIDWRMEDEEAEEPDPRLRTIIGRLWRRLAYLAGSSTMLSEIEGPYSLLLVDRSSPSNRVLSQLDDQLRKLVGELADQGENCLVYELGRDFPTLLGDTGRAGKQEKEQQGEEERGEPEFITKPYYAAPLLLGPILEAHRPEEVCGVGLLIGAPPIDMDDWRQSAWSEKLTIVRMASFDLEGFDSVPLNEEAVRSMFSALCPTA